MAMGRVFCCLLLLTLPISWGQIRIEADGGRGRGDAVLYRKEASFYYTFTGRVAKYAH